MLANLASVASKFHLSPLLMGGDMRELCPGVAPEMGIIQVGILYHKVSLGWAVSLLGRYSCRLGHVG